MKTLTFLKACFIILFKSYVLLLWCWIRNIGSILACSSNREPTQTVKWFIANILVGLPCAKCITNSISWGNWLNSCKFPEYPFTFLPGVCSSVFRYAAIIFSMFVWPVFLLCDICIGVWHCVDNKLQYI